MELFRDRDRGHVRLRSRDDGTYLHADEDGCGVSLSPHRASLNTAWAVHLLPQPLLDTTYLLLHSAAYGRYLGVSPDYDAPAPPQGQGNHPVRRMVQCLYETQLQPNVMWQVVRAEDGDGGVFLRRLAGNYNQLTNSPWIVEAIPHRPAPPELPDQIPNGVAPPPVVLCRMIRYIRADDSGIFILPSRGTLHFDEHRALRDLIVDLANQFNDNFNNITLCVKAGSHGRLTPLVVNLPLNEEPMDIVVLTTGSAAAMELRHPNVDAP